ncbi:hypothetical protein DL95DRAFT_459390 [Leptodontidium sp. 2 PMI_412]|nr:hypothetical protein DL95DRAFT_459390 [Leptodontidium sp. 2 PMI_412]
MRADAHNKENVAPKASAIIPATTVADSTERAGVEDLDGFVEVHLGAVNDQIDENLNSNSGSSSSTTQADEKGKRVDTTVDEDNEDMGMGEMDGLGSMESSTDLGDVGLEELLEIEKEIPDDLDLDTPESPTQPYEPFGSQPSGSQSSPLFQIYPHSLDPQDMPAPLQVRKSSYFSLESPMQTDSEFEEDGEDENEEADNWLEEGVIENDGIRRHEVEMNFAEWRLNRHPILGKYRVKENSCLRVCETIEDDTSSRIA